MDEFSSKNLSEAAPPTPAETPASFYASPQPTHPQTEIIEEMRKGDYDLVILGAPLPDRDGRVSLTRVVEGVMKNAGDCSLLIVRSHYSKN